MENNKTLDFYAWIVLLLSVLYFGGHFMVATANGWDGLIFDYGNSGDTDISIDTGTRETISDTVIIEPGYDIAVTDSENETIELEVITVNPDTGGPVQIEAYDSETNEYYDLEMNLR